MKIINKFKLQLYNFLRDGKVGVIVPLLVMFFKMTSLAISRYQVVQSDIRGSNQLQTLLALHAPSSLRGKGKTNVRFFMCVLSHSTYFNLRLCVTSYRTFEYWYGNLKLFFYSHRILIAKIIKSKVADSFLVERKWLSLKYLKLFHIFVHCLQKLMIWNFG